MKIRVLELCAGYGSQAMALKELGFEVYSEIAEFDKYASEAYNQLHGETKNYGDIYTIDETKLPYFDMITYSTPCQDFSTAGKQQGGEKGTGTRSSLLWECERIIRAVKPKYLLMENVKNLMSDKFRHTFNEWFGVLQSMGYRNYYQVLNAKDYGIPQNRERIFCVSILGDEQFLFPTPIKLEKRLKDILEPKVDEKYYLKKNVDVQLIEYLKGRNLSKTMRCGGRGTTNIKHTFDLVAEPINLDKKGNARCLCGNYGSQGADNILNSTGYGCTGVAEPLIAASRGRNPENPSDRTAGAPTEQRLEINTTGCSNTLTTVQKDNYVVEPSVIQVGNFMKSNKWDNPQCGRVYSQEGCSPTLNTCGGGNHEPKIVANYRIRRLTPHECWRLMGVPDHYYDRLHDISNTQLYKLAGNSIVVDVLKAIFKNLLMSEKSDTKGQLNLF